MKPVSFKIYAFNLPLKYPVIVAGKKLSHRSGLLLELGDEKGSSGWGEVSPLPGLHRQTAQECLDELVSAFEKDYLGNIEIDANLPLDSVAKLSSLLTSPASRFGLESAFLNLLATAQNTNPAALLNTNYTRAVYINGLLIDSGEDAVREIARLYALGYRSVKIKTGRHNLNEELENLRRILAETPADMRFRLDANRRWTLDEALHFVKGLPTGKIEYVEEPLKNPQDLPLFCAKSPFPVALDETLRQPDYRDYLSLPGVGAAVLKPTVLGGIRTVMERTKEARREGCSVVISDTFSSGVGLATHLALAAALSENTMAGLDTYRYLQQDVLTQPLTVSSGRMDVDENMNRARQVNRALLSNRITVYESPLSH